MYFLDNWNFLDDWNFLSDCFVDWYMYFFDNWYFLNDWDFFNNWYVFHVMMMNWYVFSVMNIFCMNMIWNVNNNLFTETKTKNQYLAKKKFKNNENDQ